MEGRVQMGFTGYTSISRMQIYTDDYLSILEMMVRSAWRQRLHQPGSYDRLHIA